MNRHSLTYIDLHPQAIDTREPSSGRILLGAALVALTVWGTAFFVFSL